MTIKINKNIDLKKFQKLHESYLDKMDVAFDEMNLDDSTMDFMKMAIEDYYVYLSARLFGGAYD